MKKKVTSAAIAYDRRKTRALANGDAPRTPKAD
jgi:hypothetical protein